MFPCAFSALGNTVMHVNEHKKRGNGLFECFHGFPSNLKMKCDQKKENTRLMIKLIPFSYELGHLFLHLFPLQLFLQQNLESCDAAVALGIFLIGLQEKHRAHTRNALNTLLATHITTSHLQPPASSVKYTAFCMLPHIQRLYSLMY